MHTKCTLILNYIMHITIGCTKATQELYCHSCCSVSLISCTGVVGSVGITRHAGATQMAGLRILHTAWQPICIHLHIYMYMSAYNTERQGFESRSSFSPGKKGLSSGVVAWICLVSMTDYTHTCTCSFKFKSNPQNLNLNFKIQTCIMSVP